MFAITVNFQLYLRYQYQFEMEEIKVLLDNPLIKLFLYVAGGMFAYFLAVLAEKYKNKQIIIEYLKDETAVGLSNYGGVWGNIEVTHNGIAMGNMTLYNYSLNNISGRDLTNKCKLRFNTLNGSEILSFISINNETGETINLDSEFIKKYTGFYDRDDVREILERIKNNQTGESINVPDNIKSSADYFATNKIFNVDVFNRKTTIDFSILVGNKDISKTNSIEIKLDGIGVKIVETLDQDVWNKRVLVRFLAISLFVFLLECYYVYNAELSKELSTIILGISGILCFPISFIIFSLYNFIKKFFS